MKLFIAEKPDIAKSIAAYIWPQNDFKKESGYFYKGDTYVSWALGHIVNLPAPEAYGVQYKSWSTYPVYPEKWKLVPIKGKESQLKVLTKLIPQADEIIHAGDPDREGQLLIEELLYYCGAKGKIKRLLLNAKDDESLKRAFNSITDNARYKGLYAAGLGREQADWLIGYNLTRAYSVAARKYFHDETLAIGRVKTPTLALVVRREKDIKNFQEVNYFELKAYFTKDGVTFATKLVPKDKYFDSEGHIKDKAILHAIGAKLKLAEGIVDHVKLESGTQAPPLPYSLDTLQIEAGKKYKLSPKEVLNSAQRLYEGKYTSYPRSDCNYIPNSQKDDAQRIMNQIANYGIKHVNMADLSLTSKCWNDKKVTAHHAIIPTGVIPEKSKLSDTDQKIYELICIRYMLQFFAPCEFQTIKYDIQVADEIFHGSGKVIKNYGYRVVTGMDEKEGKDGSEAVIPTLPNLHKSDNVGKASNCEIESKKTKPPKRFTDSSLLAAMTNIYLYMDPNNPNRDKLKEIKGIGTPATRADIINDLLATERKGKHITPMLIKSKGYLIPTDFGTMIVENVAPSLTIPDTTAEMEYKLNSIINGEYTLGDYIDSVINMVNENIDYAEKHEFPRAAGHDPIECPRCHKGELIRKYSPLTKSHFWVCNNDNCVKNPFNGKPFYYNEVAEKPVIGICPDDNTILNRINGKNGAFWSCLKCKRTFNDINGKPDYAQKPKKD